VLDTPAVVAHARLVVVGGDSYRLHEEVIFAGGRLREGRLQRAGVPDLRAWFDAPTKAEPSDVLKARLLELAPQITPSLMAALEAWMRDRTDGLQKQLDARMEKEVSDITAVMNELKRALEHQLDEPDVKQLELFSLEEREQLRANTEALRYRLNQIPEELEKETAAIHARYANIQPRMFPVAVTFLVPERLARSAE
jgi:CHAD domain-containing protein